MARPKNIPPVADRLRKFSQVDQQTGCHNWTGHVGWNGYACLQVDNHARRAHRVAYELAKGPIAPGLWIDHLCRNRRCVNPDHMEAVTPRENTLRGEGLAAKQARQTHCKRGHPLTGTNLYINPTRNRRICKECRRASVRKRRLWKVRRLQPEPPCAA